MIFDNVKVGDSLEITSKQDKYVDTTYTSLVCAFFPETVHNKAGPELLIQVPVNDKGSPVSLSEDMDYCFLFLTGQFMYSFDGNILYDFMEEDDNRLLRIRLKTLDGEKIQRRKFFRTPCTLPMQFSPVLSKADIKSKTFKYEGIIRDISASGLRFVSNAPIEEGARIKCITMVNKKIVFAVAKCLHKKEFPNEVVKYQYRVMFESILPEDEEKIVQFVFANQRKNLVKKTSG